MSREIVLVEVLDGDGRVRSRERVALLAEKRDFSIGRGITADVVIDDAHAAALHASVEVAADGSLTVSDLGSVNGIVVAGTRLRGARGLRLAGNEVQVGRSRLRIRTASEVLAPEEVDDAQPASRRHDPVWIAAIAGGAILAHLVYLSWLAAPRDFTGNTVALVAGAAVLVTAWVAVWGLLTRIMRGEWRILRHVAIVLGVSALFAAANDVIDIGWFMLSIPPWGSVAALIGSVAFGWLLYLHLSQASNLTRRRAAWAACIIPALLWAGGQWMTERSQTRDVNHIGGQLRLYPPAWRLRPAETADAFFRRAATLRTSADDRRNRLPADETETAAEAVLRP